MDHPVSDVKVSRRDGLPVTLGDRKWMIDTARLTRRPKQTYRAGYDNGLEAGEQSLSNEDIWRRSARDWVLGSGQEHFDEVEESERRRFRISKGCDVWTRRNVGLLPDTGLRASSSEVTQRTLATASRLWHSYGGTCRFTADPTGASPSWTSVTSLPGGTITSLATDGAYVYIATGAILERVGVASTAAAQFGTETPDLLHYASGRLIAGEDNELYEIAADGSRIDIWTHPSGGFVWDWVLGTLNGIYAGGNLGGRSEVYLLTVVDATGALAAPYPVLPFVSDETIRCAEFYAGYIIFGTSRGVRLCRIQGSGFLSYGPYLPIGDVLALCSRGEFIWFSWSNYDATSTGLGRLSLKRFTEEMVPAYASDLMFTGQGAVQSIASFGDRRYFAVSGDGLAGQETTFVDSGTINSGLITYGVAERKAFISIEGRWDQISDDESISLAVVDDLGVSHPGATSSAGSLGGSARFSDDPLQTEQVEVVATLTASTDNATSPQLHRWTLRAIPMVIQAEEIQLPLLIHEKVRHDGVVVAQMTPDDIDYIIGLRNDRTMVTLKLGSEEMQVYVSAVVVLESDMADFGWRDQAIEGVYYATCVTINEDDG